MFIPIPIVLFTLFEIFGVGIENRMAFISTRPPGRMAHEAQQGAASGFPPGRPRWQESGIDSRSMNQNDYPAGKVLVGIMCAVVPFLVLGWWLGTRTTAGGTPLGDLSDAAFVEIRTLAGEVAI
jgi:hypothetical protein